MTILFVLLAAPFVRATTYYVATTGNNANSGTQAQPFKTIRKGMDTAADGDRVLVADGTYYEHVLFFGQTTRDLIIQSQSGNPAACIIDCQSAGSGFFSMGGQTTKSVIGGFTIRNGDSGIGGGIYIRYGGLTVNRCIFSNNRAGDYGGGIGIEGAAVVVQNSVFLNNTARLDGGGIGFSDGHYLTARNCLFAGNHAYRGGGIGSNYWNSSSTLTNCTFANNSAALSGNAVEIPLGNMTLTNCILWGGDPTSSMIDGPVTVTYSNIERGYAGTGNISADPKFVNAAAGNYRLQATSPCVNTGSAAASDLPASDIEGLPRTIESAPDMGAYEFWRAGTGVWFVDKALGNDIIGTGSPKLSLQDGCQGDCRRQQRA